ncbi:MAG: nucleotide sugar dehydrogenase [Elusimicrobia bacterium]|nr:nucleotide sugar dehydrogenase [Elusimicrobiota bacterium]MDE2236551.1 nucleotide sugar dehydrogenase [Elusimicrobiota bacterium]MDE2426587.1 nucleotide sugar dehydrogenase [Elusimicrobiota bacterium]
MASSAKAAVRSPLDELLGKIKSRKARVGVVGLGYVGLPLVRLFASKGFPVLGFDIDAGKVDSINRGKSYIQSVASPLLARLLKEGRLGATADFKRLSQVDAVVICVPTPLTPEGRPDVSFIKQTAAAIASNLRRGQLVSLESTSYPGTTRELMKTALEKGGLRCGRDFFLAFSPEREDPGNKRFTNESIPKIVGGIDEPSRQAAAALYGAAVARVVQVSSCEAAEAAKLLENIYRCVNIALVNELKMCFDKMGIDVWEVIEAAATKPFGFQRFSPGPGLGGHCIPIDPFYLSWKAREFQFNTRFIDLAGELNVQMPYYVVGKLEEALRARGLKLEEARILIVGLAYKKDIDDPRESPAFKILELLAEKGAKIAYHDPRIPAFPAMRHYKHLKAASVALNAKELSGRDAVVVVTDHSDLDYALIAKSSRLIVDTRNAMAPFAKAFGDKIVKA